MSKIIELARKLKALADKGYGGEKMNAMDKLAELMAKHKLTIEDIEGEAKDLVYFKVDSKQQEIFGQIVFSVLGKGVEFYADKKRKGYVVINLTAAEAIEVEAKYDFFWRLYKEEFDIWRDAFIHKNRLFHESAGTKNLEEMSQEEIKKALRMLEMAKNIRQGEFRKQIKG